MRSVYSILTRGGPTHQSLSDIGEDYNLGGAGLPHHTSRPSQLMILHFPPKDPARSQVNNLTNTNLTKREIKP
jgi:hypothetical protein